MIAMISGFAGKGKDFLFQGRTDSTPERGHVRVRQGPPWSFPNGHGVPVDSGEKGCSNDNFTFCCTYTALAP
jgi:hypothetical protein